MCVVVDAAARVAGRPPRVRHIADGKERCRDRHRDRNDEELHLREIHDRGEQDGRYRPRGPERRVLRFVTMLEVRTEVAREQPQQIQERKPRRTDPRFQRKPEEVECHHIEEQVRKVRVHEAARYDRLVATLAQEPVRPEKPPLDELRRPVKPVQARGDGQPENDDCNAWSARSEHRSGPCLWLIVAGRGWVRLCSKQPCSTAMASRGILTFQVSLMATLAKKSATAPPTIARMPEDIVGCERPMCVLDLLSRGLRRPKIRRLENER